MKTRSFTVNVTSDTDFKYQNVGDSGERPRLITINNDGASGIYIKWMNIDEGNGETNDKFYMAPSSVKTIEIEGSELSIDKIGVKLSSSASAQDVYISATVYEINRK